MVLRSNIDRHDRHEDPKEIPKHYSNRWWVRRANKARAVTYSNPIAECVDPQVCQHFLISRWFRSNKRNEIVNELHNFDKSRAVDGNLSNSPTMLCVTHRKSVGSSTKKSLSARCCPPLAGRIISNPLTSVKLSILSIVCNDEIVC